MRTLAFVPLAIGLLGELAVAAPLVTENYTARIKNPGFRMSVVTQTGVALPVAPANGLSFLGSTVASSKRLSKAENTAEYHVTNGNGHTALVRVTTKPHIIKLPVTLAWNKQQTIRTIHPFFDVDYDHAMESVQFGHHDSAMPFCVKAFRVVDDKNNVIASEPDNHQAMYEICFDEQVATAALRIEILETRAAPAALFGVRCYG